MVRLSENNDDASNNWPYAPALSRMPLKVGFWPLPWAVNVGGSCGFRLVLMPILARSDWITVARAWYSAENPARDQLMSNSGLETPDCWTSDRALSRSYVERLFLAGS